MKNLIPIIVLTLKNSIREKTITNRLKLLKLNYKIIYGVDGRNKEERIYLNKRYNKFKSELSAQRELSYEDIACSYGHLKIYQYIVKKKIETAIIMEDDCFPSKYFHNWLLIDKNFLKKYDIIQFTAPRGFIYKKPINLFNNQFSLHKAKTKLPTTTCYQINIKACKYILKISNKKVCGVADWPINFLDLKIKQFFVLPIIASVHYNHIKSSFNKLLQLQILKRLKIKKFIPLYNIFVGFYYLLHFPYFLKFFNNYKYYQEEFLRVYITMFQNFFSRTFIDLEKISLNQNLYITDLHNNVKKLKENSQILS